MQHFITVQDLTPDQVREILEIAADLKAQTKRGVRKPILAGHVLTQIFEKPSLRTRVSFEAGISQLGGRGIFLSGREAGLEGREPLADVARVISAYSDVVVMRTFSHALIEDFARHSRCSVINGLSDATHPCQALTDVLTMQEFCGNVAGRTLAYIGDGNNVAVSLASICAMLGTAFVIAAPEGYALDDALLDSLRKKYPGAELEQVADPHAAVKNADIIYTDVWASMGQEEEKDQRSRAFAGYQVNAALMSSAPAGARFMHCLPARRGLEVDDEIMNSPQCIAFEQAENRMHLAKGVLVWLLAR